jgi:hypothetical protein
MLERVAQSVTRLLVLVSLVGVALIVPTPAPGQTAAEDVTFDDSGTTTVTGDDVQEVLEAVDAAITPSIDSSASIVHLRTDCTGVSNCLTDTGDLTEWLWGGDVGDRDPSPSASDRVTVRVGPGDFAPFRCTGSGNGYVTVIGSGRDATRFVLSSIFTGLDGAIRVDDCAELEFGNLEATGEVGVLWLGDHGATWWNVDMVGFRGPGIGESYGQVLGWYDLGGETPEVMSEHFMFGVRIEARGVTHGSLTYNFAVDALNSDIWFYGGDIHATNASSTGASSSHLAIFKGGGKGIFRAFGSTIRVDVGAATSATFPGAGSVWEGFAGIVAIEGQVHVHGGVIRADASASSAAVDTYGIFANDVFSDTFVHTLGTTFVIIPSSSGTAVRTQAVNGAVVQAAFQWPEGNTPPAAAELNGSGIWVDTEAGTGDDESHLMVRDEGCTGGGGPWRDMATGDCRVD